MEINGLVFPHPHSSYDESSYGTELVYITRNKVAHHKQAIECKSNSFPAIPNITYIKNEYPKITKIPSIFLKSPVPTSKILLYFHANAEDIGLSYSMMKALQVFLSVHIIIMEYKGYGIYSGKTKASSILRDSEAVITYIQNKLEWESKDIILMGRSIGCYFALSMAIKFKAVCSVILVSPFTSIRNLVKLHVGKLLSYFVKERFKNIDLISKLSSPCLIISGMKDKLAPPIMAENLNSAYSGSMLYLNDDMDHSHINIRKHITLPIKIFIRKYGIKITDD
jgi:hypothetical protein